MHEPQLFLLVGGAAAVAGVARHRNLSAPLLLVLAGLAASFVPGIPDYGLDPQIVLFLVLPPCSSPPHWTARM